MRKNLPIILVMIIFLSACGYGKTADSNRVTPTASGGPIHESFVSATTFPTAASTPEPTQTSASEHTSTPQSISPTTVLDPSKISSEDKTILFNDFETNLGNWTYSSPLQGSSSIRNGKYVLTSQLSGYKSTASLSPVKNVIIETKLSFLPGDTTSKLLLSCREMREPHTNSVTMMVDINGNLEAIGPKEDGSSGFLKVLDAHPKPLKESDNFVALVCYQNTVAVYFEDHLLGAAIDLQPIAGDVGVGVFKGSDQDAAVLFDYINISAVDEAKIAAPNPDQTQSGLSWDISRLPIAGKSIHTANFSQDSGGWIIDPGPTNMGSLDLFEGKLKINAGDGIGFASTGGPAEIDSILQFDFLIPDKFKQNSDYFMMVMTCRHKNADRLEVIHSPDEFTVIRHSKNTVNLLKTQNTALRAIPQSGTYTLTCIGDNIALYLDGELLGSAIDTDPQAGDNELYMLLYNGDGPSIGFYSLFDNVRVSKP